MALPIKFPSRYQHDGQSLEGGQGTVYICKDLYLDRKVAIKVMKGVDQDLFHEVKAIQRVRSRRVAQLYDLIRRSESGFLGLVQEYVPGPTLSQFAASAEMSSKYAVILYQVACGLSDIHESGTIHRDIKPSNIRLDDEGIAKILDFGFAADESFGLITVDSRGTPCYIAPELFGEPPVTYTSAVDTFAFGVMARTIAEGGAVLPAFRQTPPYAYPFPSFATNKLALPQELVILLDRTLSIDPNDRPKMADVRDALSRRLLYGQHRAIVSSGLQVYELCEVGQSVRLNRGTDTITIKYDGLQFAIETVVGDVYINNAVVAGGHVLPGSCVVTLGHSNLGFDRTFVSFNVSHPGVVL